MKNFFFWLAIIVLGALAYIFLSPLVWLFIGIYPAFGGSVKKPDAT